MGAVSYRAGSQRGYIYICARANHEGASYIHKDGLEDRSAVGSHDTSVPACSV